MRVIGLAVVLTLSVILAPPAAEGQQTSRVSRIGFLSTNPPPAHVWEALLDGLRERGYIEGQNLVFERRFSEGNVERFRPGPPPQLSGALYARDYNETKSLGGARSTTRTAAQTEAVKFWTQANLGPAWQEAARQLSAAKGLGLAENARLFALLNMGVANTFITDWDAKFTYNFWRPVTAIRNGDTDSNDGTERDPAWTPLNDTPMHPEYPSQAAIICGVVVGIFESVFAPKPAVPFTTTDLFDPNLKRRFNNIAEMDAEHKNVRIWGGIHFRNSLEVGNDMGKKIAA